MTDKETLESLENKLCPCCKKLEKTLIRLSKKQAFTLSETKICVNPKCPMFINTDKLEGWKLKFGAPSFARDYRRQLSPNYNSNLRTR